MHFFSRYFYIWKFDSELEAAYLKFICASNLISLRLVNLLIAMGMVLFIVIDVFRSVNYSVVLLTRFVTLVLAVIFLILGRNKNNDSARVEVLIALSVSNLILFSFLTSYYGQMPSFFLTNLLITVLVLVPTISGLRFRRAFLVNLFYFFLFVIFSQWLKKDPFYFSQYPNLTTILVYTVIAGVVVEGRRRKSFLQYRELRLQKELVDDLNQQKNKIISILSHDVASPLNSLSGLLTMQTKGYVKLEEMAPFLSEVGGRLESVSTLLQSLVRWSKSQIEGFVPERKPVDLNELIAQSVRLFASQAKEKGIHVSFYPSATRVVAGDSDMISLCFRNLISNAIKFSTPHSIVEIEVSATPHATLLTRIANEGKEIPTDVKEKLFTYQIHSTEGTLGERGTGLGLAMSSYFLSINSGRIYLDESRPGWVAFCVELPSAVPTVK